MSRFNAKTLATLAATACLASAAFVASPRTATAAFERYSPGSCFSEDGSLARRLTLSSGQANVYCELPNRTGFESEDITRIQVFTYDGSTSSGNFNRARVCGTDRDTDSVICGSYQTGASGHRTLLLSTESEIGWLDDSDKADWFATLHVQMESTTTTTSTQQRLLGYTVRDD